MKIKDHVDLKRLEIYGYRYQENLIYPTYRKVIYRGNQRVVIEIVVMNRSIFVNRNALFSKIYLPFLKDLFLMQYIENKDK